MQFEHWNRNSSFAGCQSCTVQLNLKSENTGSCSTVALRSRPPCTGVPRGPGRKVLHGVLFECFWAPASECNTECFLSALWRFLSPKTCQKALKKHSLGHSEPSAQKHSKSTPWSTFRPGPLGTLVNGGRDRNPSHFRP